MGYDLHHPKAPRLSGAALVVATSLLENGLTGARLARSFFRNLEIDEFRRIVFKARPMHYPLVPPVDRSAVGAGDGLTATTLGDSAHFEPLSRPDSPFRFQSALSYARAYRDGTLSPVTVAERIIHVLDYQDRGDPPLYAFIRWDAADIRAMAAESAQRIQNGTARSLLEGVPISVKDFLDQRGYPTSIGTSFLVDKVRTTDAFVVERLRNAGALLIGKTNMHEAGLGVTGLNPFHGTPINPYAPWRYPGGSSSGSASSVAAGLCVASLAGDGGGSIRIPASFCGLYGLKPTFGRVSDSGAYPLGWSVAHIGPIAATPGDLALVYAAIAGPDPADPNTHDQPPVSVAGLRDGVRGLRIGVFEPWFADSRPDVAETCRAMLQRLTEMGAELVPIEIPELNTARIAHLIIIATEVAAALDRYSGDHRTDFSLETRSNIAIAQHLLPSDYLHALQARRRLMRHLQRVFESVDLIATPTAAILPPAVPKDRLLSGVSDLTTMSEVMRFAVLPNLLGLPAVSVPAGFITARSRRFWHTIDERDASGHVYSDVPVGLQFMARHWQEQTLLRVAYAVGQVVVRPRPRVYLSPYEAHNPLVPGYDKPTND